MFDVITAESESLRYLPPVCGTVATGMSCYLSLYHQGEHLAPDPTAPVDSGRLVSWGRALEAC